MPIIKIKEPQILRDYENGILWHKINKLDYFLFFNFNLMKNNILLDLRSAMYSLESIEDSLSSISIDDSFKIPEEYIYKDTYFEDEDQEKTFVSNSYIIEFKKNIHPLFQIQKKKEINIK